MGGDVSRWCSCVERATARPGLQVGSISVTNEANLTAIPVAPDGAYPNAPQALAEGLVTAAGAKRAAGATAALGFTAVDGVRAGLNVARWELFTLRDADSGQDDPFCQFGILRDGYSPKTAYAAPRALIRPRH